MPPAPKKMFTSIPALFTEWQLAKKVAAEQKKVEEAAKARLKDVVASQGRPGEKGHLFYRIGQDVTGFDTKGNPVTYNALQNQRRSSVVMDEEEALTVLERLGIMEECSTTYLRVTDSDRAIEVLRAAGLLDGENGVEIVTQVDQGAVQAAYFEDKISKEDYNRIFTEQVTWALLPVLLSD